MAFITPCARWWMGRSRNVLACVAGIVPAAQGSDRPNVTGDPYAINRTLDQDFNAAVFVANAPNTIGNLGRNTMRQRGFFNWDFSSHKEFRFRERLALQFRFEAFHFTNTPRFGLPGATLGTATFGKITSADTPRNLQFGMKLVW